MSAPSRTARPAFASAAACTTSNVCSSSGRCWRGLSCANPTSASNSGSSAAKTPLAPPRPSACAGGQPQRLRGPCAEQQLCELVAEALAGDEPNVAGFVTHLLQCRLIRGQTELGNEAQATDDAQRVLREASRADGAQDALR